MRISMLLLCLSFILKGVLVNCEEDELEKCQISQRTSFYTQRPILDLGHSSPPDSSSFIIHYKLAPNHTDSVSFNESILMARHREHFQQVSNFLKNVDQKIQTQTDRSVLRDIDHKPSGDEFLNYSITDLWWNATADSESTPTGYGEITEKEISRAYVPNPPQTTFEPVEAGGPDSQPSKPYSSYSKETVTINLYQQFGLPSPSPKRIPHGRGYASKYRRPKVTSTRKTTVNLYEFFSLPSPGSKTAVTKKPDLKLSFYQQIFHLTPNSNLLNTPRGYKTSKNSQITSVISTAETKMDVYKNFGLPSPESISSYTLNGYKSISNTNRPPEVNKPTSYFDIPPVTTKTDKRIDLYKKYGLPSPTFMPTNTPTGNKMPSNIQKPAKPNNSQLYSHVAALTRKPQTTVNLYKLFGLPSPTPRLGTPEDTGYDTSSEARRPLEEYNPPSSKPKSKSPLYQQFKTSSPSTVLSSTLEDLQPPPSLERRPETNNFSSKPQSPKNSVEASYHRNEPPLTYPPRIYQRGIERTQSATSSRDTESQIFKLPSTAYTNYMQIWLHEMSIYTPVDKRLLSLTMREMTPNYYTSKSYTINHSTSTRKIRGRLRNRHLKTSKSSPADPRQSISLPTTPSEREDYDSIAVEGNPVYKSYDQTTASIKNVLHKDFASPYKRYEDMMDELKEGYMIVFLLELTRLVTAKNPEHVYDVISHAESVLTDFFTENTQQAFGQPLVDMTVSLGRFLTEAETDAVRSYASIMHHLLRTRRSALAADLNSIIDDADLLYEHDEGYMLFDSLMEFHNYPIVSRTSREVCEGLLESFLRPFRRLNNSEHRQALLDSVNDALVTRFPGYRLRSSSEEDEEDQSSLPTKKNFKKSSKHDHRGRRNKRRYRTKTRRVEYTNESLYRRHYSPEGFPMTRSMKPTTQLQRQFSMILPRFRGNTQTEAQFFNVRTRPMTDYEAHTTQFFHEQQATLRADAAKHFERREQSQRFRSAAETDRKSVSVFLQMKCSEESQKKAVSVRRKAELLRRIVESSSYSDEEEALKRNLLQALQRNSSGVEDVSAVNNTVIHAGDTVDESLGGIETKQTVWPNYESDVSLENKDGAMQNDQVSF